MVDKALDEITSIPGVTGVFIASGRGVVLYGKNLQIDQSDLEEISLRFLRMSAIFNDRDEEVSEIEMFWKDMFMICKFFNNILLVTVCTNPKILPLIRITLNVCISDLLQDKKLMKLARSHATDKTLVLRKGKFEEDELNLLSNL